MQPLNTQLIGDFLYSLSVGGKADDHHYATMDADGNVGVEGSRRVKQSDGAHTFALRINDYMDRMAALEKRVQDKLLERPLGERSVNNITRPSGWSYSSDSDDEESYPHLLSQFRPSSGDNQDSLSTNPSLQSQAATSPYSPHAASGPAAITTPKGKELLGKIRSAYEMKEQYREPSQEFLGIMESS